MFTLAEVKDYLGIDAGVTTWDTFLTQQEAIVSEAVEAYCSRKFNATNYEEIMYRDDYEPSKSIMLYQYPIITLTSVTANKTSLSPEIITDYRVNRPTGILSKIGGFFSCADDVTILYRAGYETIPPLLTNVVMSIIQENLTKKQAGIDLNFGKDVQRVSIPGTISIDYDYSLANNDEKTFMGSILGNYLNVLNQYKSERRIIGSGAIKYVT